MKNIKGYETAMFDADEIKGRFKEALGYETAMIEADTGCQRMKEILRFEYRDRTVVIKKNIFDESYTLTDKGEQRTFADFEKLSSYTINKYGDNVFSRSKPKYEVR